VDNTIFGYLDVDVSLQQDADQVESQWEEELAEMGYEPVEYTASFLATGDEPASIPREVLKESIWIGIRGVNPDIDSVNGPDLRDSHTWTEHHEYDPSEISIENTTLGPTPLRGSIEKYLTQAVPTINDFDLYGSILTDAKNEVTPDEADARYFVKSQATGPDLSETLRGLEQNGITGLRVQLPNGDETWQVYQEHNPTDKFYEASEITGKYNPTLENINL
jgi:hypothetical protein